MPFLFGDSKDKKDKKKNKKKDVKITAKKGAYIQMLEDRKQREKLDTRDVNSTAFLNQQDIPAI